MAPESTSPALPLFCELAAIPSPPGRESAVARRVTEELERLGLAVHVDDSGARVGSDTGNLLARLEPAGAAGGTPIFFCAHLDTVPPLGPIEPIVEDGYVRNAAGTILGADNKAALAVMLEAARRVLREGRPHAGIELVFTTREETGLQGAAAFDTDLLRARAGFVYDHAAPIGDVVVAAPYQRRIDVAVHGRAAHAGINPEDGRSAIQAAARAVADLRLGRLDDETTLSVGTIAGGTQRNVVPELCRLEVDARSRDERKLIALVEELLETFAYAASLTDCRVETVVDSLYLGYRLGARNPALRLARGGLERAGFAPREVEVGGGADANVFNAGGLPCVVLANGMEDIHSPGERIAVADLDAMVDVTLAIVEEAAALEPGDGA
ncbi:MAG: M20/M25/M40 family metallo-hydrolase [Thermoleophilia bacterium]|nr:M20/M25/M40 family metallo-hydrolase [Thermoleophilia bacterium]